jgi:hypothetical protein
LVHDRPFVYGSIVTSERKCGKNGCWCLKKTAGGHVSSYLSVKVAGKRKMVFIPQTLLKKAQEWILSYRQLDEDILKISESCLERLRDGQRA